MFSDLVNRGFRIDKVRGDGNCLFRAVSLSVYGNEEKHEEVRRLCVAFMLDNGDTLMENGESFCSFIVGESLSAYCKRISKLREWGDHLEVLALSGVYRRSIVVYRHGSEVPETICWPTIELHRGLKLKPISLSL